MKRLRLSPQVALPCEAVTQTFAILGKRGSGKTNSAGVMTEQMIAAGLPVIAVDPIGVWWGLRHSRSGKGPGLSVVILGGEHADVPLEETGGAVVADFLIEHRAPAVLDLGLFSKGAQRRFMCDFAERLYHKNRDAMHLVLDEADTFVPQRIDHGGERLVGAINDLVRKGRARGIGVTLISQRPALVNKDVLTQVEVLVAHRMTGPQDRDAIERWIEHNADGGEDVLKSLQSLGDGDAWVWSPSWLKMLVRTHINLRSTFDSSATPKAGSHRAAPKKAAEVDLAALRDKLAATIEKAAKDDPRALRAKIAELEKASKAAPSKVVPVETRVVEKTVEKIVEVPAFGARDHAAIKQLAKSLDRFEGALAKVSRMGEAVATDARTVRTLVDKLADRIEEVRAQVLAGGAPALAPAPHAVRKELNGKASKPAPKTVAAAAPASRALAGTAAPTPPDPALAGGHRRVLLALAQHGGRLSKRQIAVFAGYTVKGGGFNNILGALRNCDPPRITGSEDIEITMDGRYALGPFDTLPDDAEALFQHWMAHPKLGKAHREILRVLRERGGGPLTTEDVAAACEPPYEPGGGGFNNAVGRLRTMGVIEGGKHDLRLIEQLRA